MVRQALPAGVPKGSGFYGEVDDDHAYQLQLNRRRYSEYR
jgi:hypothetical protein